MLIVDDNTEFLETLSTVLSSDFDTITATGVKDAWNILQAITVDAICSDFNMKAGTGLDLLEDIREKESLFLSCLCLATTTPCLKRRQNFMAAFSAVKQIVI